MKKFIPFVISFLLAFALITGCSAETPQEYTFNAETNLEIDGRSFILENTPENIAEDIVVKDFLYSITGEFDKKFEILADIDVHVISIDSENQHKQSPLK